MKYFVNDGCIGCGLCAGTCPDVFSMSDDGVAVAIDSVVPEGALDTAAEAKENCPGTNAELQFWRRNAFLICKSSIWPTPSPAHAHSSNLVIHSCSSVHRSRTISTT